MSVCSIFEYKSPAASEIPKDDDSKGEYLSMHIVEPKSIYKEEEEDKRKPESNEID